MKENSQWSKVPKQSRGAWIKKSKVSKRFEFSKITDMMMLNQVKKEKKQTKSPSPTLGGTINHFGNKFK
jgi:hypothetical protein